MKNLTNKIKLATIILTFTIIILSTVNSFNYKPKQLTQNELISMTVVKYSSKYNLDPMFVYKIIDTESTFRKKEVSPKNAMGLMQIVPETAKEVYNKIYKKEININQLFDVKTNIEIGCFYLNYLSNLLEGDKVKILCAYNAGIGNVRKWERKSKDLNSFKKNITFKETRDYVKKITGK